MRSIFKRCMLVMIAITVVLTLTISTAAAASQAEDRSVKTEVINSSTSACNDNWAWTGDGDKIASLPYGEITTEQIYVAAICSPYWANYTYSAEPTNAEVIFTAGEGLVDIALRVRKEGIIWGGSECVYAEITPTAAASHLDVEKTVSGTFKMFYSAWGTYCRIPFEVTLKPSSAGNEESPPLPDPGPNPGVTRAGMAVVDITPARDVYLQGYDGATDASLAKHPSNFKSDINARILILDNGSDRLVFINLELVFSGSEYGVQNFSPETLQKIAQICHTDTSNIMLSNTHNHQSYMVMAQREEQRILQGVAQAYSRLAPVKIGTTTVNTQFGISRGNNYTMDTDAPYDSLMTIVRFDNAETGMPMGLIYSVPMHNTMFSNGPGLNANIKELVCEFTGYASREIEAQMASQNPDFTAMHINGFYGNAGPYANGKWYANSLQELKTNGAAFAEEILAGFHTIETQNLTGDIQSAFLMDTLPANKSDQAYREQFGDSDQMPLYITLGAFGDIGYVGVNYEPFSIIGARLKAESPYRVLLPAGNVSGWKGYIPTKEAYTLHKNGTNQAECVWNKTPFDAQAEEIFYDKVLSAVCDMQNVSPLRIPMKRSGVTTTANAAEYVFYPSDAVALDKIVISFGQNSRTDCAMDFDLLVYDDSDQLIFSKTYSGNTVNYLGEFTDGAEVAKAILRVRTRYGRGTKGIAQLQPQIWGVNYRTLPPYTETVSDTTDYANFGGANWEVEPMTVETTIGPREKFTVALATSYWANPDYSGYKAEPTKLNTTFTNGEGLLDFYVTIGAGPIWGGAECELLTIVPTNSASALTKDTTITGTIEIYWRGWVQMPFSVTIDVPDSEGGETPEAPAEKTEVISDSIVACGDDWSWTGNGDKIATLPAGEITTDQIYIAAVCTPYWTDYRYTTKATETDVTFASGEGLVTIALRVRNENVIWGGADCVYAEITPTAAGEAITEPTTVSGTFQLFYASWGTYCSVPFEITLKPAGSEDSEIVGDLNGDATVSNDDVIVLLWHTLFPEENPISANADLTGDGIVTNADVVLLLWHTLFPEEYPLI